MIGDLQEERARRARLSRWRAALWYWRAAAGLVVHIGAGALPPSSARSLSTRSSSSRRALSGRSAADGLTFVVSITGLTLAALLASLVPALAAARTDPVRTLRNE
jgi:hypothetical protein